MRLNRSRTALVAQVTTPPPSSLPRWKRAFALRKVLFQGFSPVVPRPASTEASSVGFGAISLACGWSIWSVTERRIGLRKTISIAACLLLLLISTPLRADEMASTASDNDASQNNARHYWAGWPQCVSRIARPSIGCHESGYYVGGGAAVCGDARCTHEGTFGWDYHGRLFPNRITLGWYHGRRSQGGGGAYRTD